VRLHNRLIKASFWTDSDLLQWPRDKRWFYEGLTQLADDSGCLEDSPFAFKLHLFPSPLDADITINKISAWVQELVDQGKLYRYKVDNKPCLYLGNFHKHQSLRSPAAPVVPLPPWIKYIPSEKFKKSGTYEILTDSIPSPYGLLTDSLRTPYTNQPEPEPEREREPEPERERELRESVSDDAPDGAHSRSEKVPFTAIIQTYNSICTSLPKAQTATEGRKRAMRVLWKRTPDLDQIADLFKRAEASDFLTGRDGKWTGCGFDWLIKPANMTKLQEGNYDNKEPPKPKSDFFSGINEWVEREGLQ
jgi:hypothetical protein